MGRYKWVWADRSKFGKFHSVGILADGTLYNPNAASDDAHITMPYDTSTD